MNSRRPTTAGMDQLSLNLSVTKSPDTSVLVSVLLCLAGCLEAVGGTAQ